VAVSNDFTLHQINHVFRYIGCMRRIFEVLKRQVLKVALIVKVA
jgi:hypothetical protein